MRELRAQSLLLAASLPYDFSKCAEPQVFFGPSESDHHNFVHISKGHVEGCHITTRPKRIAERKEPISRFRHRTHTEAVLVTTRKGKKHALPQGEDHPAAIF